MADSQGGNWANGFGGSFDAKIEAVDKTKDSHLLSSRQLIESRIDNLELEKSFKEVWEED